MAEYITNEGVVLIGGNGIKRAYNKQIWDLADNGYLKWEITGIVGCHRNTTYRHLKIYGRL